MKIQRLLLCVPLAGSIAVAACSQALELSRFQYTPNADISVHSVKPPSYSVLYSFGAKPDGEYPSAGLIGEIRGSFYGTTSAGGGYNCVASYTCGTVFSITTGGTEKVLHSFQGTDGGDPLAGVIDVGGRLYGTTYGGGPYKYIECGDVFSITTGGAEKVLHNFGRGTDGCAPAARLTNVKGTLYGTTVFGGAYGCGSANACGTVFSITTGGTEKVLHSFGYGTDGSEPLGGLIDVKGTLYGTTVGGGKYGSGTFFSITTGGSEKILHSFGNGTDGEEPIADLIDVGGTLYSTTEAGGKYYGGTVFSITTGGKEKVLYSFPATVTDGETPEAALIDVKGTLYGTTYLGGAYGLGTLYSITAGGTEKVLHSFGSGKDGSFPMAGLNYTGGKLVGTTWVGGTHGYGTVFSLTP